ncbi:MAG: SMI1/KNR4 family protein [Flavitalea sp.]
MLKGRKTTDNWARTSFILNNKIEKRNEFGKLGEIELSDFEEVNNIKLPDDYRKFLLKFNGGSPRPIETGIRSLLLAVGAIIFKLRHYRKTDQLEKLVKQLLTEKIIE